MRLYRSPYTVSWLMMSPHNYLSRSSLLVASFPMTLQTANLCHRHIAITVAPHYLNSRTLLRFAAPAAPAMLATVTSTLRLHIRMSFVPEQEAQNFDKQGITFWSRLMHRDIASPLFFQHLKLGGLWVGSAWQSIIPTLMATTQSLDTDSLFSSTPLLSPVLSTDRLNTLGWILSLTLTVPLRIWMSLLLLLSLAVRPWFLPPAQNQDLWPRERRRANSTGIHTSILFLSSSRPQVGLAHMPGNSLATSCDMPITRH